MKPSVDKEFVTVFTRNLFEVSSIDTLAIKSILRSLEQDKFACIRGLVMQQEVQTAKTALKQTFSRSQDHPSLGESPDQVKTNFQKLSVGVLHSQHHTGSYARLLRTFYNPLWAEDIYQIHLIFRKMIAVRNRLLGKPDNFATDRVENGLWTAARIHQYPRGGGFMGCHRDKTLANVANQANLNYFQLLLIMSQKGIDFQQGGGFIENDHKRFFFEDYCQLGDLVIYDSYTLHGVADIDPHRLLDLDTISGRIVAFVSLYKSL